jgi:hypothetical protein
MEPKAGRWHGPPVDLRRANRNAGLTTECAVRLSVRPQPVNAYAPGVDRQFAGFYRERYLLSEADPVVEKELHAGLHENPAG